VALRELALRQAAHEVEHRLETGAAGDGAAPVAAAGAPRVKIVVLVTATPETVMLIRRAKRVSDFLGAECFAVTVQPTGDLNGLGPRDREAIEKFLNFARNLHIETRILEGSDPASALVDFAHRNGIQQIFLAKPRERVWIPLVSRDVVQRVVEQAKDMQVVVVSDREA
jgi:K+-sensing histidine kinase KdpD